MFLLIVENNKFYFKINLKKILYCNLNSLFICTNYYIRRRESF